MAIAKVQYKSSPEATPEVWMDTTQKTVTAANLSSGETALKNDGTDITGALVVPTTRTVTFDVPNTTTTYNGNDFGPFIASGGVSNRTAGYTNIFSATSSAAELIIGQVYSVTGTIKIIDNTKNVLETCTLSGSFTLSQAANTATDVYTGNSDSYIQSCKIYKNSSSLNFSITFGKTASYGINASAILTSINSYSFSQITINKGYTERWVANLISNRNSSSGLTDITWPDGITSIASYAFANCYYLNTPNLPSTLTTINEYAFYGCNELTLTTLPSSITLIGSRAFSNNYKLALTSLPSGLTLIRSYAFFQCFELALTSLPSNITLIEQYAFAYCRKLALTSLPSTLTKIESNAFFQCTNMVLTNLPSNLTYIGNGAFQECPSLITISCEGAITTLGSSAFLGTSTNEMQLTSASFPNMALASTISTVFGSNTAVYACHYLAFVDIGNTIGIQSNAFANCYALQTLVLRRTESICSLSGTSAFNNTPMSGYNSLTGTVYVPSALISSYQTATNWSTLYNNGTVTFSAIEGSAYEL